MKSRPSAASIGVLDDQGAETVITREQFCSALDVDGWVRLHERDFGEMSALEGELVHFNLESANHVVGRRYGLVPILRAGGRLQDGTERLPIVDMKRCRAAICTDIMQRLPIEAVTAEQFERSLPSIRSTADLRRALIARYSALFPDSSPQALIARGCALTRFRFVVPTELA